MMLVLCFGLDFNSYFGGGFFLGGGGGLLHNGGVLTNKGSRII